MTITHTQSGGNNGNNTTSVSRAFGSNLAVGSLIVVKAAKFSPSSDAFVSGDCTQSAGTATLSAFTFDRSRNQAQGVGGGHAAVATWSAIVTGAGSCTIQVAGAVSGSYLLLATAEFGGSWDSSRVETGNDNGASLAATTGATSADSGSVTSAGAALFISGLQVNASTDSVITEDASFTLIYENQTGTDDNGSFCYRIVSSGTTDTCNYSYTPQSGGTTTAWASDIVVYKEVAGGASSILPQMMQHHEG